MGGAHGERCSYRQDVESQRRTLTMVRRPSGKRAATALIPEGFRCDGARRGGFASADVAAAAPPRRFETSRPRRADPVEPF